jgi:hypothetical protein
MNTAMWDSPFTARHLRALGELGEQAAASGRAHSSAAAAMAAVAAAAAVAAPVAAREATGYVAVRAGTAPLEAGPSESGAEGGEEAATQACERLQTGPGSSTAARPAADVATAAAAAVGSTVGLIPPVSKRLACGDLGTGG